MAKFKIEKKGYCVDEVNRYLAQSASADKDALAEKSMRIEELKAENARLQYEVSEYRKREANVNAALVTAVEKAKEMDYSTKIRFALEGERVKLFRERWTEYCTRHLGDLLVKEKRGTITDMLKCVEDEIVETMAKEFDLTVEHPDDEVNAQYMEEAKRILQKARKQTGSAARKDVLADAFNLNDIDNPPKLEEICKQMGLMMEA